MSNINKPAIWFPTIQTKSGSDVFTKRLVAGLRARGLRSEIFWLPHHAEYLPWLLPRPKPPKWANIVHVNTWMHQHLIPSDKPIVATIHHCVNDPVLKPYKKPLQKLYHQVWINKNERSVLSSASKKVAVSKYTASSTSLVYNTTGINVIPLGININGAFYPEDSLHEPHQPFRLLFIGNLSYRKGADLLIPIIKELGSNFELWVLTGLRNKTKFKYEQAHNIKYLQPCPDDLSLGDLYRQCDALIFPSRLEGFGLVALEAQACGLPVISTNGSALPEVVENEVTGILCPKDDIKAFVDASQRLAQNKELCKSMSNAARCRVKYHFNLDKMVDQYIELYQSIL